MAAHSTEPEQAEMRTGSTRASSNARATPISATVRPPPAPPAIATRLPRSASAGRERLEGKTAAGGRAGRSITGNGSSVRRAFTRNPGSRARLASSPAVRAAPLRPSKADMARVGYGALGRRRATDPHRDAARARARDRRGHADERPEGAVLRGRQARDPAAGRLQ